MDKQCIINLALSLRWYLPSLSVFSSFCSFLWGGTPVCRGLCWSWEVCLQSSGLKVSFSWLNACCWPFYRQSTAWAPWLVLFAGIHPRPDWLNPPACSTALLCQILPDPIDSSLPGSSDRGIFQARMLDWVAISSFRGSSTPGDRTRIS